MNEEQLRQAFQERVTEEVSTYAERRDRLLKEASDIRERFRAAPDPDQRRRLENRYREIDLELGHLKKIEAASEEKTRGPRDQTRAREKIERGRKHLLEKARMGAGEQTQNRIKGELMYLINNYTPSNDARIEMLIDKWRRSGDPSYDPGIRMRFRQAAKKKSQSDNPL